MLPSCLRTAGCASLGVVLAGAGLLASCSKPPSRELEPGIYRAVLDTPGGKALPFGLDVAREESGPVLYLVNGPERVRVSEVEATPGRLTARVPGYETTLTATISGGKLAGEVTLVHGDDRKVVLPLVAQLGETWRFHKDAPSDNADLAGRWDVTFVGAQGQRQHAVAELSQRFNLVSGTVVLPDGDQRFLAGEVRDEALQLSRFDGGAAVLYEARLDAKGRLVGETWSDRGGSQRFVATRNPDAVLDGTPVATRLRDPLGSFNFSFRDPDGRTLSSTDPRFIGKVLLVTLAGSWCPNSQDEAKVLVRLQRAYREQGLEVVSLMFEQHAEFDLAVAAVRRFRAAHGIDYATLIAGRMDRTLASAAVPQLDAVHAYPTVLFIDRTGRVRKVHAGFAGPATGVWHERLVHEFEQTIETLLLESPTDGGRTVPAASPGSS